MIPKDDITDNILEEIQQEIKEEKDFDLSKAEISKVAASQIDIARLGINRGLNIHLPIIGKFFYTKRGKVVKNIKSSLEEIQLIREQQGDLAATEEILKRKQETLAKKKEMMDTEVMTFQEVMNAEPMARGKQTTDIYKVLIDSDNNE